ncbi:MAG: hypothetical protein NT023_11285, partial [Armatimonadetes bacterium]|nr:hypothetical protein [Armatimonadota bacterium]
VLDLQARPPLGKEKKTTIDRGNRVKSKTPKTGVHGYRTPEAFAVEDAPIAIDISDGVQIHVPHPYAWINIKIAAGHDWLKERRGEIKAKADYDTEASLRLKHVTDVYVLVAMLTEQELDEAKVLAQKYKDNEKAIEIRNQAIELFGSEDSEGSLALGVYARQAGIDLHYETFWETLKQVISA